MMPAIFKRSISMLFAAAMVAAASLATRAMDVPFDPPNTSTTLTTGFSEYGNIKVADMNNDGDLDVIGSYYNTGYFFICWENTDGAGTSWGGGMLEFGGSSYGLQDVADLDGDGRLDIIAIHSYGELSWWRNEGIGAWSLMPQIVFFPSSAAVIAADMNSDGITDLAVYDSGANTDSVYWLQNLDGTGTNWTSHPIAAAPAYLQAVGDFNHDGAMDAVVSSGSYLLYLYLNSDKNGTSWTEITASGLPDLLMNIAVGDIDGDGSLDIVATTQNSVFQNIFWLDNSAGDGTIWTLHSAPGVSMYPKSVTAADLDGDGDLDILVVDGGGNIVWDENTNGDGSAWIQHGLGSGGVQWAGAADMDKDGDLDILSVNPTAGISWSPNASIHRSAKFQASDRKDITNQFELYNGINVMDVGDINGNGLADVVAVRKSNEIAWFERQPFQDENWISHAVEPIPFTSLTSVVKLAKVDRDDALDVIGIGHDPADNRMFWWRNEDARGTTWSQHLVAAFGSTADYIAMDTADFNGDGYNDIVTVSQNSGQIKILENPSSQVLTANSWTAHSLETGRIALNRVITADMDRDGACDFVVAAPFDASIIFYRNQRTGHGGWNIAWEEIPITIDYFDLRNIYVADMNGDGKPDVLAASDNGFTGNNITWFENPGTTTPIWQEHVISNALYGIQSVWAADMDGDGDMDVLQAESDVGGIHILAWWENLDGRGGQWAEHDIITQADANALAFPAAIMAADISRDGKLDVIAASPSQNTIAWWPNRGGQFSFDTTDVAPAGIADGGQAAILKITAQHNGRPGESPLLLSALPFALDQDLGLPLASPDANALIAQISLWLDDGSGAFESASDTLVATQTGLLDLDPKGLFTFSLPAADPLKVDAVSSKTYFLVVDMQPNASLWAPNQFAIVHFEEWRPLTEALDGVHGTPLLQENPGNAASSLVTAGAPSVGNAPDTPVNIFPADNLPHAIVDHLSASTFFDPDTSDTHPASQWQIRPVQSAPDYSFVVFDSGPTTADLETIAIPEGYLNQQTWYAWHARYQDSTGRWSDWSGENIFSITGVATYPPPDQPANITPATSETDVSLAPRLMATRFSSSNPGDYMAASQWRIRDEAGTYAAAVYMTTQTTGAWIHEAPLGYLAEDTIYFWQTRYSDSRGQWSPWSDETSFRTIPTPGALAAPDALMALMGARSIRLLWHLHPDYRVIGYNAYRADYPAGAFAKITTQPLRGDEYLDMDVAEQTYLYQLTAVTAAGEESAPSSSVLAIVGATRIFMTDMRGKPGDLVYEMIALDNPNQISNQGLDIQINYDPAYLTPVAVTTTTLTSAFNLSTNIGSATGTLQIAGTGLDQVISGEGNVFKAQYQLNAGASYWTSSALAFNSVLLSDQDSHPIDVFFDSLARLTVAAPSTLGDLTGDGRVNLFDAILLNKLILGIQTPNTGQLEAGDINGDTVLDSADLVLLLRMILSGASGDTAPDYPKTLHAERYRDSSPVHRLTWGTPTYNGGYIAVPLILDNMQDVAGVDLVVNFDPQRLKLLAMTKPGSAFRSWQSYEKDGQLHFVMGNTAAGVGGPQTVATITFVPLLGVWYHTELLTAKLKLSGVNGENLNRTRQVTADDTAIFSLLLHQTIDYLSGRLATPPSGADANGDGVIDVSDTVWMMRN
ncbi:MAG: FG-GAP-like repeat-containing protein [Candidatus Sumerlaeota bacterium]|nr:FG-GAP-like repeat-containing protein [Candidatus Sumerlaeota bacterium]